MARLRSLVTSGLIGAAVIASTVAIYFLGDARTETATGIAATAQTPSVAVTVASARKQTVQRIVPIVGTLFGLEEIPIAAKVEGRVAKINHDVGDVVHPGEVLFEIDPTDHQLKVAEAERSLEMELSKIGLKAPPSKDSDVDIDRLPSVVRAASQLKLAELEFDRSKTLFAQRTISQADYDKVQTDLSLAKANHEQAVLDARTILASVRQKQAALESAKTDLTETRVLAPSLSKSNQDSSATIDYVVAERSITEGEFVRGRTQQDAPAFRLVIAHPLKLKAAVAERFKSELKVGMPVGVFTEATAQKMFLGLVKRVNPTVDRASRTFQVEVEVPNPDRQLSAGSFAKAGIRTRLDDDAITVPNEAVIRFAGVVKVFVVRDGKVKGVPVALGEKIALEDGQAGSWIEVVGQLSAGEAVVTSGQSQLADDTPVTVREAK